MPTGKCPHGEFDLAEGCAQCIEEARISAAVEAARVSAAVESAREAAIIVSKDEEDEPPEPTPEPPESVTAVISIAPENDTAVLQLYEESKAVLAHAQDRAIVVVADLVTATEDLTLITNYRKALEEKRKEYVSPIRAKLDAFNALFKEFMAPVTEAEELTKTKMLQFHAEQKRKRLEAERIESEKLKLAQAEQELKGEHTQELGTIDIPTAIQKSTRTEVGTASTLDVWKYEVFDLALLPDAYKVADHAQLQAIAKKHHDGKPVPGVRFYNEPSLSMRPR